MVKCEDGKDVIIAQKCIKAGEEITINYRPELAMMKRDKRQKYLLDEYYFSCNCEICENDDRHLATALICQQGGCNGIVAYEKGSCKSKCFSCGFDGLDVKNIWDEVSEAQSYLMSKIMSSSNESESNFESQHVWIFMKNIYILLILKWSN